MADEAVDMVNAPPHYRQGSVECIDAIESALGKDGHHAYLRGQVFKYLWRCKNKGSCLQDLQKAEFYLKRLIELEGKDA